jgi:hypothetical protein
MNSCFLGSGFKLAANQYPNYVYFQPGNGCSSYVAQVAEMNSELESNADIDRDEPLNLDREMV